MPSSDSGGNSITHHSCRSLSSYCGCLIFLEFAFFLSFSGSSGEATYGMTPGSTTQLWSSRAAASRRPGPRVPGMVGVRSVGPGDSCTVFLLSSGLRTRFSTPWGDLWFNTPIIWDLEIATLGTAGFLACFPGWRSHPRCLDPGVRPWGPCHEEVKQATITSAERGRAF